MQSTLLFALRLSLSWHGLPVLCWCSLISHLIKTVSTSHGSSLTTRLLGDVGIFLAASVTPETSEEREVQVCSRTILLGEDGRADSWLWEETCEGGLAKRPTVRKGNKQRKAYFVCYIFILSVTCTQVVQTLCFLDATNQKAVFLKEGWATTACFTQKMNWGAYNTTMNSCKLWNMQLSASRV